MNKEATTMTPEERLRIFTQASPLYEALETWYDGPVTVEMLLEAEAERQKDLEEFLAAGEGIRALNSRKSSRP